MTQAKQIAALFYFLLAVSATATADGTLPGLYQTQAGDSGGYLHVRIGPCEDANEQICGTIEAAFKEGGALSTDYEHLGKKMLWGMKDKGGGKYTGGKIWAPDRDKTYRSKMQHDADNLTVKGCIGPLCRAQAWQRVE